MRANPVTITKEQLEAFREIASRETRYPAVGVTRRLGASREKALSIYKYNRWFKWNKRDRDTVKSFFPDHIAKYIIVAHLLEIPAETGFLDLMDNWVGLPKAGYIVSVNIGTTVQEVFISGKKYSVRPGENIAFSLVELHEIKPSKTGQLWGFVMLPGPPLEWKDEIELIARQVTR